MFARKCITKKRTENEATKRKINPKVSCCLLLDFSVETRNRDNENKFEINLYYGEQFFKGRGVVLDT